MIQKTETKVIVLYESHFLADVFEQLDQLHTVVSEGQLHTLTTLDKQDVVGWLQELIFTAEETVKEMENCSAEPKPIIQLLDRPEFKQFRLS
jgi:hypothetical protein